MQCVQPVDTNIKTWFVAAPPLPVHLSMWASCSIKAMPRRMGLQWRASTFHQGRLIDASSMYIGVNTHRSCIVLRFPA